MDIPEEELSKTYLQWATDEVLKVGYISLYHLWEKQIVNLLKYQLAVIGERYEYPKKSVSLVDHVKTLLKHHFDTEIEPRLWCSIDEARTVTNTYKHATTDSYQKLLCNFPEYFTKEVYKFNSDEESSFFLITQEKFRSICEAIEEFWDEFPHEVDYSHSFTSV
jgi:collagenase-like PrtC family protease